MTTYASNKDGNSIMIDAQAWEELQAMVKRQRVIIEMYNNCYKPIGGWWHIGQLDEAYEAAQDTTSMTGASEK